MKKITEHKAEITYNVDNGEKRMQEMPTIKIDKLHLLEHCWLKKPLLLQKPIN